VELRTLVSASTFLRFSIVRWLLGVEEVFFFLSDAAWEVFFIAGS